MELQEVVLNLASLDEDAIICVQRPWSGLAEARVVKANLDLSVPVEITNAGFAYFVEVHVAREVLGILANSAPTLMDRVRLLLDYAENDAYPDWIYAP